MTTEQFVALLPHSQPLIPSCHMTAAHQSRFFAYSALVVFKHSAENRTGLKAELIRSETVCRYKPTAEPLLAGLCGLLALI